MGKLVNYALIYSLVINIIFVACLVIYRVMLQDVKEERGKIYLIALACAALAYIPLQFELIGVTVPISQPAIIAITVPLLLLSDLLALRLFKIKNWLKVWLMFVGSFFLGVIVAFFLGPMALWWGSGKGL